MLRWYRKMEYFKKDFDEFKNLPVGWDQEGGLPMGELTIRKAQDLYKILELLGVEISNDLGPVPLSTGGVDINFKRNGFSVLISIDPEGLAAYCLHEKSEKPNHKQ